MSQSELTEEEGRSKKALKIIKKAVTDYMESWIKLLTEPLRKPITSPKDLWHALLLFKDDTRKFSAAVSTTGIEVEVENIFSNEQKGQLILFCEHLAVPHARVTAAVEMVLLGSRGMISADTILFQYAYDADKAVEIELTDLKLEEPTTAAADIKLEEPTTAADIKLRISQKRLNFCEAELLRSTQVGLALEDTGRKVVKETVDTIVESVNATRNPDVDPKVNPEVVQKMIDWAVFDLMDKYKKHRIEQRRVEQQRREQWHKNQLDMQNRVEQWREQQSAEQKSAEQKSEEN